jgi:hypothetical protein
MSLLIYEVFMLEIRDVKYKRGLSKALNKIIWVKNDLFGRRYLACAEGREDAGDSSTDEGQEGDERGGDGDGGREGERLGVIEERVGKDKERVSVFERGLPGDED